MTARTPTTFNVFNDLSGVIQNKEILAAHQNAVLNDQQYALVRGECLCSYVGSEHRTAASSWNTLFRLSVRGRDMCGTIPSGVDRLEFCIRCKCTVDNDFVVGLYDPNQGMWIYYTITTSRTTYAWRGWTASDILTSGTAGDVSEYLVGAYIPAPGTGIVSVTGVGIFAPNP